MTVWMNLEQPKPDARSFRDELPLSVRAYRAVQSQGCTSLTEMAAVPEHEWLRLPNVGIVTVREIASELRSRGFIMRKTR